MNGNPYFVSTKWKTARTQKFNPRPALDLDGLLFDFVNPVCEAFGLATVDHEGDEELSYNFLYEHPERMTIHRADQDEYINGLGTKFWEDLPLLKHAKELVAASRAIAPVTYITDPGQYEHAAEGKMLALRRHGLWKRGDNIIFTGNKAEHVEEGLLLVDDYMKNIDAWRAAGGHALPVRRPWTLHAPDATPTPVIIATLKSLT